MENYLIGRETLGKFIDQLIAQKYVNQFPDSLKELRGESIKKLDNQVSEAIFSSLDDDQLDEISAMFDREENDPTAFQIFFKNADVNLEQIITDTMTKFSQEFLGGENA